MARILDEDGDELTQSAVTGVTYSIFSLASDNSRTVVTGHDGASLTVADVIFDTLLTTKRWTRDDTGYNFRHVVDISANAAFSTTGKYLIEYIVDPAVGQNIIVRFLIMAK